ncbi:MAG TPA: hypothetical protein VN193_12025 [Candidatus Angelobacter sp.]|jgi:hypothetical protein|nr:hypothetical protein [Candidatus Angelobacter sp.]
MNTQRRDRLILILDRGTRALVGQCSGPDDHGGCPVAVEGHQVPCAGRRIVPAYGTGIEGWRLTILDHEGTACPLAAFVHDD